MTATATTTAYRYHVASTPGCGIIAGPIDIHAETRADADLMVLRVQERFFGGHAKQDNTAYEWTVRDRNGWLLVTATSTPEGTTYRQGR
jgi:hypothetical protein